MKYRKRLGNSVYHGLTRHTQLLNTSARRVLIFLQLVEYERRLNDAPSHFKTDHRHNSTNMIMWSLRPLHIVTLKRNTRSTISHESQ